MSPFSQMVTCLDCSVASFSCLINLYMVSSCCNVIYHRNVLLFQIVKVRKLIVVCLISIPRLVTIVLSNNRFFCFFRLQVLQEAAHVSQESIRSLYPFMARLQCLAQLEEFASLCSRLFVCLYIHYRLIIIFRVT